MVIDIITIDENFNDILHDECKEISLADLKERNEWYTELADNMLDTVKDIDALGLAANQIGASIRMFVLADGVVILNPKIIAKVGRVMSYNEGCLSVPGLRFNIKRHKMVVVKGVDLSGEEITYKASNKLTAFAIQHEMDHLNGFTLMDLGKEV